MGSDRQPQLWRMRYVTAARLASTFRRSMIRITHRHCMVEFGEGVQIGPGFSLFIPHSGSLIVGPEVEFRRRFTCEISGSGRVVIGARSVFTYDTLIQCTTSIEIGRDCLFAQGVLIVDGSHRFRDFRLPISAQGYDYRSIRIGDGAAVMAKSTVIADVGEGAFVGANSVVTRPIPPYCLAVGAPARVADYYGPAELRPPGFGDRVTT